MLRDILKYFATQQKSKKAFKKVQSNVTIFLIFNIVFSNMSFDKQA